MTASAIDRIHRSRVQINAARGGSGGPMMERWG
jgi:hypothetical protein